MNDFGYFKSIVETMEKVNATQSENIRKAGELMANAIANGRATIPTVRPAEISRVSWCVL